MELAYKLLLPGSFVIEFPVLGASKQHLTRAARIACGYDPTEYAKLESRSGPMVIRAVVVSTGFLEIRENPF